MARKPIEKKLVNTRLLKEYASWVYCGACNATVAYLCYVTYNRFEFTYTCRCGSSGHVYIAFTHEPPIGMHEDSMKIIKNRLCCRKDDSPLASVVERNLLSYKLSVICASCNAEYHTREG